LSDSKNTWGLRILAVALAVTAWFVFSIEKREQLSEKVIEATIRYDNFPGLIMVERLESVRVGVRGTVSKMRTLNPFAVDVFVELSNPDKGVFEVPLTSDNVFLPEDLEVVSIEPNIIRLKLDREAAELLPVLARLEGVMQARQSKYVMLHAPRDALEKITELLPGVEHPSIMPLEGSDRIAIHAVCGEAVFWEHLEALKAVGASAILVLPVEKMLA